MIPLSLAELITRVLILLIVFPAHELAHAVAATRMGDPTPGAHGRLTLNPLKHLDLMGSVLFVFAGIGWAYTPVNPAYFGENRRMKMGLVSLSGPLTNLALGMLGVIPFYLFRWSLAFESASDTFPDAPYFFTTFIILNLLLAAFNLIPIAPLDGAQVLGALIPETMTTAYDSVQKYGTLILIALVFVLPRLGISLVGLLVSFFVSPIIRLLFLGMG